MITFGQGHLSRSFTIRYLIVGANTSYLALIDRKWSTSSKPSPHCIWTWSSSPWHDVVIIYSTSSCHTPLNYAPPTTVTRDQVQEMICHLMDTFDEHQRQENMNNSSFPCKMTLQHNSPTMVLCCSKTCNKPKCLCWVLLLVLQLLLLPLHP